MDTKIMETRNCQNCKTDFIIEPDDFGFYEKMGVPAPTFCAECRRTRRWAWRNAMSLYNRKCMLCDKSVVSIYAPDSPMTIYCNKCWWSDKWDAKSYGVDYDFSKPFFTQMDELLKKVPQMSVVNDDGIASLNSEYTHDWWFSKNCYMCFTGWKVENAMYCYFVLAGKDIMDCAYIRSANNWIYDCLIVSESYKVKHSRFSKGCLDSAFLKNCVNCSDCLMCNGLHNKKYHFKNQEYSKEDYEKILASYQLDTYEGVERARKDFEEFVLTIPERCVKNYHVLNCTGNIISYSKNSKDCYSTKKAENSRYLDTCVDDKESYDLTTSGELSECYEGIVADHSQRNFFAVFSVKNQDVQYTQHCHSSKYLFGCVGLRNAKYCIFNKQYTKEEYEELVPKIITQMNDLPYVDAKGSEYRYGEFYPIELSPFGYNESIGQEENPLERVEALTQGYKWQDHTQRTTGKETLRAEDIPQSINNVDENILNEVLACISCHRNYKIVPNELIFYKAMKIPVPRICFYCRHASRLKTRYPMKLWQRECMCDRAGHDHEDKCQNVFGTSYPPDGPEIVYCEKCYQQEFY